jgi:hypothetical protein
MWAGSVKGRMGVKVLLGENPMLASEIFTTLTPWFALASISLGTPSTTC